MLQSSLKSIIAVTLEYFCYQIEERHPCEAHITLYGNVFIIFRCLRDKINKVIVCFCHNCSLLTTDYVDVYLLLIDFARARQFYLDLRRAL